MLGSYALHSIARRIAECDRHRVSLVRRSLPRLEREKKVDHSRDLRLVGSAVSSDCDLDLGGRIFVHFEVSPADAREDGSSSLGKNDE